MSNRTRTPQRPPPPPPFARLLGHATQVLSLQFLHSSPYPPSRTSPVLVSGDASGHLRAWSLAERETRWASARAPFAPHGGAAVAAGAAAGGGDGAGSRGGVISVRALRGGCGRFLTQGKGGEIAVWELGRDGSGESVFVRRWESVFGVGFCGVDVVEREGGEVWVAGAEAGGDGEGVVVVVVDVEGSGSEWAPVMLGSNNTATKWGLCTSVRFVDDGKWVLMGCDNGGVRLWRVATGEMVLRWDSGVGAVLGLDVSGPGDPDRAPNTLVATVGSESTMSVQTLRKHEDSIVLGESHTVSFKSSGHGRVAFRADGKLLAVAGWDSKVRIFGSLEGKKSFLQTLAILRSHESGIQAIAWKDDILATTAKEGDIALSRPFPISTS